MFEEKLNEKEYEKKNNSIKSPKILSSFDQTTEKEIKKNDSQIIIPLNKKNNEISFQDKISEKIGSIKSIFRRERLGLVYCISAQFFWTLNNVILKFITRNYKTTFTNKSY